METQTLRVSIYDPLTIDGQTMRIVDWAKKQGIAPRTIVIRIRRGNKGEELIRPVIKAHLQRRHEIKQGKQKFEKKLKPILEKKTYDKRVIEDTKLCNKYDCGALCWNVDPRQGTRVYQCTAPKCFRVRQST